MDRDTICTIDKAARAAIMLVEGRTAAAEAGDRSDGVADKLVLFDASALAAAFSKHLDDGFRGSLRHRIRILLQRFTAENLRIDGADEKLFHRFDNSIRHTLPPVPLLLLRDSLQSHWRCDADPVDRALVWEEPELAPPMAMWSALGRLPLSASASRWRYLLLAQAGAANDRRRYVVFVQSAERSDHEPYRTWIEHRAPAVLKFNRELYCHGSFASHSKVKGERAARELLMCVVPLDPAEPAGDSDASFALSRITTLLCHRLAAAPDTLVEVNDDEAEDAPCSHEAWLSLSTYANMFLGDGERRRCLDAHRPVSTKVGGEGHADPGEA